ncbi:MAG TPA: OmpH family outer membrane protein [Terriglobia bacterium]|nr:OmpH family outer membrane protein [Terriglobia bacterium]
MKNRVVICTILAGLLSFAIVAAAQDPAPTGVGGKIGLISIQQAILATGEGKQAMDELQKKYEPRRQQLQRDQDSITQLTDQLQKQGPTLSDEEASRLRRELDRKQSQLKREQEDAQSDFQADNQDIGNKIGGKMVSIIRDYAQKNGYSVVMDLSQAQGASIFYAAAGVDITEPIVKLYDQANPVAAAPAPAAAKPAAPKKP